MYCIKWLIVIDCITIGIYMLIPTYIYIFMFNLSTFLFVSACSGLHHIHWLQHFITVFACLHYILLNTEVSPKIYCRKSLDLILICLSNISSEKSWLKDFTTLSTLTCALPSLWDCSSSSLEYKRPPPTL